ncbi:porin [Vibrio sp. TRT 21S02]|uniref:porin n=1 Tax=Vibrio sp. TRT 21S02 TaxID=3418507 RepID=UPI003CEBBD3D
MKKTLVALAVLAAGSAQAVELYNQDGATVNMGGDIEVRYVQSTDKGSEFKQEIDDSDLNFDIRYAVNDSFSIGGYWELNDLATKDGSGGDAYVSFISTDLGTLKVGKTATQLDDAGIGSDFLFGVQSHVETADFSGDEVIRYDLDKGDYYVGLAYMQDRNGGNGLGKDGSLIDLKAGVRVADLDISVFYGIADLSGVGTKETDVLFGAVDQETGQPIVVSGVVNEVVNYDAKQSISALQASYGGIENLNLEVGYYRADLEVAGAADQDADTFAFAADYTLDKVTFAGGVSTTDYSFDKEDHTDWFVNTGYSLAPNTTVYAEVGGNDKEESETGFGVGIKASF